VVSVSYEWRITGEFDVPCVLPADAGHAYRGRTTRSLSGVMCGPMSEHGYCAATLDVKFTGNNAKVNGELPGESRIHV
jgi:hypothetical protein